MKPTHLVVIQSGWIFVGALTKCEGMYTLTDASCVRKWGTTKGLGELALAGPTPSTILEPCGVMQAPAHAVHFIIPVEPKKWP